jgi:hypothetical protein
VLIGILIPTISRVRRAQQSTVCLATLRHIADAFRMYASDNQMRLPDPGTANLSWEQMLRRYDRAPFACPADAELYPTLGSSYDWRDTGDPATTLAGRSIADLARPSATLCFEALPWWHRKYHLNVARLDGSVVTVHEDEFIADLATPMKDPAAVIPPPQ